MPFIGLSILVQILCAVHCVRGGRNNMWLMVIIFLSIPGCLAYACFEIFPIRLLLARTLQDCGDADKALELYTDLAPRFPGGEAQCRRAGLLFQLGRPGEAQAMLEEVERLVKRLGRFERNQQKDMYGWAARTLADLRGPPAWS